ncbi:hypothetical protein GCM10020219_048180 [Nonomuraea dietziae]
MPIRWGLAAGELVRQPFGVLRAQSHPSQQLGDLAWLGLEALVAEGRRQDRLDGHAGVQRGERILKDHL